MSYFHWKYNQLSSALKRFTVLFGMGRSGTTSVWSSGKGFCVRALYAYTEFFAKKVKLRVRYTHIRFKSSLPPVFADFKQHGYRIKPHEQLVSVS